MPASNSRIIVVEGVQFPAGPHLLEGEGDRLENRVAEDCREHQHGWCDKEQPKRTPALLKCRGDAHARRFARGWISRAV